MLSLEKIRIMLKDRKPTIIAAATGLHYNTITNVRDNPRSNPSYKVIKALSDYLENCYQEDACIAQNNHVGN